MSSNQSYILPWLSPETGKNRPRLSSGSDENMRKIVNFITIQGNALEAKYVSSSILKYLDQRERDVFAYTTDLNSSEFEDYRIKSEIDLAIQFFRHNRFPEMIDRCRILNNDFPEEKLRKFKLI